MMGRFKRFVLMNELFQASFFVSFYYSDIILEVAVRIATIMTTPRGSKMTAKIAVKFL